jgi:type II secretory pathway pseudopilin PulG
MIELMIVLGVASILMLATVPRVSALRSASAVRAARLEVATVAEAARAAAIQRGRPARIAFRNNTLVATVDTSPPSAPLSAQMVTLAIQRLDVAYGVTLSHARPADTVVAYDARGFANPRRAEIAKLYVARGGVRDSVCISVVGLILPRGCAL